MPPFWSDLLLLAFLTGYRLALLAPWAVFSGAVLAILSHHLFLARVYPDYFGARHLRPWPVVFGFDLVAVLTLALATMIMGGWFCAGLRPGVDRLPARP